MSRLLICLITLLFFNYCQSTAKSLATAELAIEKLELARVVSDENFKNAVREGKASQETLESYADALSDLDYCIRNLKATTLALETAKGRADTIIYYRSAIIGLVICVLVLLLIRRRS